MPPPIRRGHDNGAAAKKRHVRARVWSEERPNSVNGTSYAVSSLAVAAGGGQAALSLTRGPTSPFGHPSASCLTEKTATVDGGAVGSMDACTAFQRRIHQGS